MIHRAEHSEDFTRLQNELIRDSRLSDRAFRILVFMFSCSDDFVFSVKGLAHLLEMPERTVSKAITELKKLGYIEQKRQVGERGRFLPNVWDVYEIPFTALHNHRTAVAPQHGDTATRSDRTADSPHCGKSAHIRTINNKELSNIKNYQREEENKTPLGEFQNVFLTLEEISKLKLQLGDEGLNKYIEDLGDYLKEHPRKKYASHYRTILKWAERDKARAPAHCSPKEETEVIDWDELRRLAEERDRQKAGGIT